MKKEKLKRIICLTIGVLFSMISSLSIVGGIQSMGFGRTNYWYFFGVSFITLIIGIYFTVKYDKLNKLK